MEKFERHEAEKREFPRKSWTEEVASGDPGELDFAGVRKRSVMASPKKPTLRLNSLGRDSSR